MNGHSQHCSLCRVELEHVTVEIDRTPLVQDVNLHIHCGELTALIGSNGAGKTTLLRALLGELPHRGVVRHVRHDGSSMRTVRTGYVPQQMVFDRSAPVTVLDFLSAATGKQPVWWRIPRAQRQAALDALRVTHCELLADRRLGALSGGELQRVLLALALTPNPDLLILDEPVSGVDRNGLDQFYQTVSELRQIHHLAILLVSHDFDVVRRYADRVVLLRRGVLVEGAPEAVFASDAFAREFGGLFAQSAPGEEGP